MKKAPAIDTLRYAQRLAETGMNRGTANVMAQALNEELEDRLLTKADLAQALAPIHAKLGEFDQRFASMDAKFEAKIDSVSTKLSFVISAMMLIVSLLVAMGAVGAFQIARSMAPDSPAAAAVERPAEAPPGWRAMSTLSGRLVLEDRSLTGEERTRNSAKSHNARR